MKIIGLEEHFVVSEVLEAWQSLDRRWQDLAAKASAEGEPGHRLLDFGPDRLATMDDSGIDVQVLSVTTPRVQNLAADVSVELARTSNDRVAEVAPSRPERFRALPPCQLLRRTRRPGSWSVPFRKSICRVRWFSAGRGIAIWIIRTSGQSFQTASVLKAPLYLHPQTPQNGALAAYYTGFGEDVDSLFARGGIDWHYEAGVQILRMVLSGVFDSLP